MRKKKKEVSQVFLLADGRQHVYQWDINVKLLLDESNESADEVHFSARFSRVSLSVEVVHTVDSSYVTIPNILLQKPNDIIAYSYITNADGSYTKYDTIIPVIARPKPSGYIYEETETLTWKSLNDKINDLGESTANSVKYTEQVLTDEQKSRARANIGAVSVDDTLTISGAAADAKATGDQIRALSKEIADGVSWNELKDKPFYLEKQLFLELTKDDFVLNEGIPFYTSSPKLDWMTSIDDVSIELKLVGNDGNSCVITENSYGIYFKTVQEVDGSECVNFGNDENFDIYSGPEDSFSINIWKSYERLTEIHLKLYRKSVKKIPGTLVDAAIGKTALTVGGYLDDDVAVVVPEVEISVKAESMDETKVFYDTETNALRIPAKIMPWGGSYEIIFTDSISTVVGNSMSFSLKEGDAAFEFLNNKSDYYKELSFYFVGSSTVLSFIVKRLGGRTVTALGSNENGKVYFLSYTYGANWAEINGYITCII